MMKKLTIDLINQKSLRIAMLGHKRIPSREGGIEVVVEELSTRMVILGHNVTCYNRRGHHVSGKEFDKSAVGDLYKGVRLKSVPTYEKKGLAAVTSSISAAFNVAFSKHDIVHFHAEGPCAMLWLPKLFGKRCIVTVHGLDWARSKWRGGIGEKYIKFGEKVAAKYADEIIVLSQGVRQYFKDTYDRETRYIPNGVNRPKLVEAKEITNKFGLHKDEYILYLGRIVPEKGIGYLVEAFKKVETDKKLVIAGGASDTDKFMNEIMEKAASDKRIIFTGFVQGKMLEELYSNAYIYTLPSDVEGMPLSLLEALSYGNCCLVSNIAECSEVVDKKAILFRKGDVADLTIKLKYLCDNPKTVQKYEIESADFVCQKYNWDNIVEKTLSLYQGKY